MDLGTTRDKEKSDINSLLSDDLLDLILSKIRERRFKIHFAEVCKRWYKVHRLSVKSLNFPYIKKSSKLCFEKLATFPNLVSLLVSDLSWDTQLETIAQTCPKLETISFVTKDSQLGREGLEALWIGCPKLSSVELSWNVIGDDGVNWLVNSASSLKFLYLSNNSLVGDAALGAIGTLASIRTLILEWCPNITDHGLELLPNGSSRCTLKKLKLIYCSGITDVGVEHLQKMSCLEHLEFYHHYNNSTLSEIGFVAISKIQNLTTLRFHCIPGVSDTSVLAQNCHNLEVLSFEYCQVTGSGIRAFATHKCLRQLQLWRVKDLLSDVEYLALGCTSLESVFVDRINDPTWSPQLMQVNTRSVVKFGPML